MVPSRPKRPRSAGDEPESSCCDCGCPQCGGGGRSSFARRSGFVEQQEESNKGQDKGKDGFDLHLEKLPATMSSGNGGSGTPERMLLTHKGECSLIKLSGGERLLVLRGALAEEITCPSGRSINVKQERISKEDEEAEEDLGDCVLDIKSSEPIVMLEEREGAKMQWMDLLAGKGKEEEEEEEHNGYDEDFEEEDQFYNEDDYDYWSDEEESRKRRRKRKRQSLECHDCDFVAENKSSLISHCQKCHGVAPENDSDTVVKRERESDDDFNWSDTEGGRRKRSSRSASVSCSKSKHLGYGLRRLVLNTVLVPVPPPHEASVVIIGILIIPVVPCTISVHPAGSPCGRSRCGCPLQQE